MWWILLIFPALASSISPCGTAEHCNTVDLAMNSNDNDTHLLHGTPVASEQLLSIAPGFRQCDHEGRAFCPESNTCCKVSETAWMCCPLASATCCPDKQHCCPRHMSCHGDRPKCRYGQYGFLWSTSVEPILLADVREQDKLMDVVYCPGSSQVCPAQSTCCLIGNDSYGCCSHADALCCSDMTHCCPQGTMCDVGEKQCLMEFGYYDVDTNFVKLP